MLKSAISLVMLIFCSAVSLEVGSFLLIQHNQLAPQGTLASYRETASEHPGSAKHVPANPIADLKKAHYAFGFTFHIGNNHGFIDPVSFPYRKKDNELVIGIFGGSTAMHWAEWLQDSGYFQKAFNKKIRVLNMALSGMKQPQQYAVASRFIETVDIALFYDGWNEVVMRQCPRDPELPAHFEFLTNPTLPEPLETLRFKTKLLRVASGNLHDSWLGRSQFIFLLWNQFRTQTLKDIQQLKIQIEQVSQNEKNFPECQGDPARTAFDVWVKYTKLSKSIADYHGVKMLHLYQANPYLTGAKPLSKREKKIVDWEEMTDLRPHSIGTSSKQFRNLYKQQGWPFSHDLAMLFERTTEITYIDPNTHLNARGYQLLSTRVAEILRNTEVVNKN